MNRGTCIAGLTVLICVMSAILLFTKCASDNTTASSSSGGNAVAPAAGDDTAKTLIDVPGYGQISIHGPIVYKKLSLFVLCRTVPEAVAPQDFITLEEGMAQNVVTVSEKENAQVAELQVENRSDKPLFIQCGDVVKGGKQDRTIQASLVVPPNSGKMDIPSLCVEQSRWTGKAGFDSSSNSASTNGMKIAVLSGSQGEVWEKVADYKRKAAQMTGSESATSSLNEEMDNEKMKKACEEYENGFVGLFEKFPDAIGVANSLNGEIYSVELFQWTNLFRKKFPKLLESFANEAVVTVVPAGETPKKITPVDIKKFLAEMEKGNTEEQNINGNRVKRLENEEGFSSEAGMNNSVTHRQYLKK